MSPHSWLASTTWVYSQTMRADRTARSILAAFESKVKEAQEAAAARITAHESAVRMREISMEQEAARRAHEAES